MSFLEQIQEERREFFQNGLLEGKQAGLSVGKREGKIETAKEMLAEGMEMESISGMTKLPESQIVQLRDELSSMKKMNAASTDTLFSAESDYDSETLAEELFKLFSSQPDKQAVVQLVNWFRQLAETGRIDPKDYHLFEREYRSAEEVRMVFLTEIEEARQRFFQNGLLEGEKKGEQKGKIETAKEMLAEGMEAEFISRMAKLPESQILQLRDELASTKK